MPVGKRTLSINPSTIRARECVRKRRERGFCSCGKNLAVEDRSRCVSCLEANRKTQAKMRSTVLDAYGRKCACCGELESKFLAVDHINGNGNQHRFSVGGNKKSPILRWLIKNNFPKDFQLLCHNCNMAKACYGICPHQENRQGG